MEYDYNAFRKDLRENGKNGRLAAEYVEKGLGHRLYQGTLEGKPIDIVDYFGENIGVLLDNGLKAIMDRYGVNFLKTVNIISKYHILIPSSEKKDDRRKKPHPLIQKIIEFESLKEKPFSYDIKDGKVTFSGYRPIDKEREEFPTFSKVTRDPYSKGENLTVWFLGSDYEQVLEDSEKMRDYHKI